MKFSEFLIKYRKDNNLTIMQMADSMEWTRMYYARFEHDKLLPTKANIDRFASVTKTAKSKILKCIEESINAREY